MGINLLSDEELRQFGCDVDFLVKNPQLMDDLIRPLNREELTECHKFFIHRAAICDGKQVFVSFLQEPLLPEKK